LGGSTSIAPLLQSSGGAAHSITAAVYTLLIVLVRKPAINHSQPLVPQSAILTTKRQEPEQKKASKKLQKTPLGEITQPQPSQQIAQR
jgi:hypothetical protein